MRAVLVCVSVSEGNTRKIADAMADVLDAEVVEPGQVDATTLAGHEIVGFGSGIYGMSFHRRLLDLIRDLPRVDGQKAFVFATRGGPRSTTVLYMPRIVRLLRSKGYDVVGTFTCLGHDTWMPLRLIGGLNKGRPNQSDLAAARAFASEVAEQHGRVAVR